MLYTNIVHPQLLAALATAGHGSTILLSDANYPSLTGVNPAAERIYLNFAPGKLDVSEILRELVKVIPIESATVMSAPPGVEVPAHDDFKSILPNDTRIDGVGRFEFYELCRNRDLALVIATGDQRLYGNLLLTVGVRNPGE